MTRSESIHSSYAMAKERYAEYEVDTDKALERLAGIAVSLHCWQGDDVGGFESGEGLAGGGIMATGNYPGKARTPDELRSDLDKALSLIPGRHRVSVHASYLETGGKKVDRNEIRPDHFAGWIDWAKEKGLGMDFNHTFFYAFFTRESKSISDFIERYLIISWVFIYTNMFNFDFRNNTFYFISNKKETEILKNLRWKVLGGLFGGTALILGSMFVIFGIVGIL